MTIQQLKYLEEKGKPVFDRVPKKSLPKWALKFLELVDQKITNRPIPVTGLYGIVENQERWTEAYNQFQRIREFNLSNSEFEPEEYLILAEKVAKVTYNQTEPQAPFDQDSGWAIPFLAVAIARKINDLGLENEIEKLIEEKK